MIIEIDGRTVRSERDVHRQLHRALDFGPYYGWNLDALWDRLSRDVRRPVHIVWTYADVSRSSLGEPLFSSICGVMRAAEAQDLDSSARDRLTFELR